MVGRRSPRHDGRTVVPALERPPGCGGCGFRYGLLPRSSFESTAIADYYIQERSSIDGDDVHDREAARSVSTYPSSPLWSRLEAEAVKYANNAWHALKINFANELGQSRGQHGQLPGSGNSLFRYAAEHLQGLKPAALLREGSAGVLVDLARRDRRREMLASLPDDMAAQARRGRHLG